MNKKLKAACAAALFISFIAASSFASDVVKDLSGVWRVTGEGISGEVRLPGTLADAKLGVRKTAEDWKKDTGRASKGALVREWQYRGKAVYEREIELSEEEAKYPLEMVLERVMLYSELAIDGETVGSCDSLAVEHVYPIPERLTKPGRHTIRLTLDNSNRYNFSEWAHSYGPVMQSVWHGVIGEFALRRRHPLRDARVLATWPANGKLAVEVPESFDANDGSISLARFGTGETVHEKVASQKPSPYREGFKLVELKLDREPEAWSEHHPNLYVLELSDKANGFTRAIRFGFRSVSAHDRAIWINGMKWFMRGNLDCCHFPLTGAPETSIEWWRGTLRRLRDEDGINTVRFHSWTPPQAAFDAADELGVRCTVEAGIWVDGWQKTADKVGYGKSIDGFVKRELRRILERRGNSPAFISLAIGNEMGGSNFKTLGRWMSQCRAFDPGKLYFASTAREIAPGDDYVTAIRYPGIGKMRERFMPSTDWDYEDLYGKTAFPVVAHEIGQWPIYVDWDRELPKYAGVLRAYNLEHYRDIAEKSGTRRFWPRFREASAKLARLMYKDEVESFMRTPSCAGLQLLSVQDFTGQGEAMIGWRDSFYELKDAAKGLGPFRDVFNELPHLARFGKYCWRSGETYKATLLVRNITEETIPEGTEFSCEIEGQQAYGSKIENKFRLAKAIAPGEVGVVGEVSLPLAKEMAGRKFTLKFGRNSWPFWVFSGEPRESSRIIETSSFKEALAALKKGKRVLYTGKTAKCGEARFKPVYWSTVHFKSANAALATLGYSVKNGHPALRGFPTDDWADWQWYNLVEKGLNHGTAGLPAEFEPIVMPVPDLHYSTPMGMLFELKVGEGRLMVCGLNLSDGFRPETRAMKKSIVSYMESDAFAPAVSIGVDEFEKMFAPATSGKTAKKRPGEFGGSAVNIAAAVNLNLFNTNVLWKASLDSAEFAQGGGYSVSGEDGWGTWRDGTGAFWHGRKLNVTLTGMRQSNATLWVRFRDPNGKNRSGRGVCEGRSFTIPKHQKAKDGIYWAKLPIIREDALDGKIELSCEALTGPNLMIDRVVLVEEK